MGGGKGSIAAATAAAAAAAAAGGSRDIGGGGIGSGNDDGRGSGSGNVGSGGSGGGNVGGCGSCSGDVGHGGGGGGDGGGSGSVGGGSLPSRLALRVRCSDVALAARLRPLRPRGSRYALAAWASSSRLGFAHTQQSNSIAAAVKGASAALPHICPSGSGWQKQRCQQRSNSHLARGCVKKHPGLSRQAVAGGTRWPPRRVGSLYIIGAGGGVAGNGAAVAISPISCGIDQFNVIDEVNYRRSTEE
jgi:hypothetical protein